MELTAAQRDRACGALLGAAAGDALGAGYEFGPPLAPDAPVDMIGGGLGPFEPGEWTDDTSMAIPIAKKAATGADLRDEQAQDDIVESW
jgi:ADP-ribosyl-[dinitrogen reductase] hydrolase